MDGNLGIKVVVGLSKKLHPNHFSLTSVENVMRSWKDVKDNSKGFRKRQPRYKEIPIAPTPGYLMMRWQMLLTCVMFFACYDRKELWERNDLLSFFKG